MCSLYFSTWAFVGLMYKIWGNEFGIFKKRNENRIQNLQQGNTVSYYSHSGLSALRPASGVAEREEKIAVIYNISDYLHLVSKSKTVKTVSALAPDKESWCFLTEDSLGPKTSLDAEYKNKYLAPAWNRNPTPHNQTRSPFATRTELFQFRLTLSDPSLLNPITV